jgi:hypothetical protein
VGGPTATTTRNGRRACGISLGRALHLDNLERVCRPGHKAAYYDGHGRAVRRWREHVVVNVDAPLRNDWCALLAAQVYSIHAVHEVRTRPYRVPANSDKRADHEVVIVACKVVLEARH